MKKKAPKNIFKGVPKLIPAPPKPVGKPATILYKKLPDDMILITGFEGFLGLDEIFDKYGRVVATTYSGYPDHMFGVFGGVFLSGLGSTPNISVGKLCFKGAFSELIAHVKKCGALLHDIILACDKGEVKRIEI